MCLPIHDKIKAFFTVDSSSIQAAPQPILLEQALLQTAYDVSLVILPCPAMYLRVDTPVPHSLVLTLPSTLVQLEGNLKCGIGHGSLRYLIYFRGKGMVSQWRMTKPTTILQLPWLDVHSK